MDLLWEVRGLPKKSQELLVQFGATKVFLKEEVPKILAAQKRDHERLMYSSATTIQTLARKYNARSEFLRTRAAVVDIQAHYKAEVMAREFDMKTRAVKMIHDQIKTHVMRKRWMRRREVARVTTHQIRANRSKERWKHVRKGLYVVCSVRARIVRVRSVRISISFSQVYHSNHKNITFITVTLERTLD